jgi:hypothetical protein
MSSRCLLPIVGTFCALFSNGWNAAAAETPALRPPAVPLVAHDPYFSIWSPHDRLNDGWPTHWTGRIHGLAGFARIDGRPVRLLGGAPGAPALSQTSLRVWPTRTVYTFADDAVRIALTFLTPALVEDLEILARPVTFLVWDVESRDGRPHDVALYFDCSGELAVNTADQAVAWRRESIPGLAALRIGSQEQPVLAKRGDDLRIDWGYAYVAAPTTQPLRCAAASDRAARGAFLAARALPAEDDARQPRPAREDWPVLAFAFEPFRVESAPVRRWLMLAYDDLQSIVLMNEPLRPWWRRNGWEAADLLQAAARDFPALEERSRAFDGRLWERLVAAGGENYARLAALAYRQALAGNKLVADAKGRPLLFSKENFSNGCIGTVDVTYPMSPLFLAFSSELSRAMLRPVMDYAASPRWKFPFAPHDLGTYPHANGQVYGGGEKTEVNQMPVEESANLILLCAALARSEGRPDFASAYWPQLSQWAAYLEAKGLDPENQLCTDDFAGHLAHNVNLSAKAILALGAFGQLCAARGEKPEAGRWTALAHRFAGEWMQRADDGDHTRLTFDKPGTWSQKYNLVWDRVLGLHLFPAELKRRELDHYRRVQQRYGLPLDSRKAYAKPDWTIWSACIAGNRADVEALAAPIHDYLHDTPDRVPFCDWYWTETARKINMIARPVIGGVFMPLLCDAQAASAR